MKEFDSEKFNGHWRDEADDLARLTDLAREIYAADFLNPDRAACPSEQKFRNLIESNTLPDEHLRAHLFCCSECFKDYRAMLVASRVAYKIKQPSRIVSISAFVQKRLVPLLAVGVLVVTLSAIFIIVRFGKQGDEHQNLIAVLKETEQHGAPTPAENQNDRVDRPTKNADADERKETVKIQQPSASSNTDSANHRDGLARQTSENIKPKLFKGNGEHSSRIESASKAGAIEKEIDLEDVAAGVNLRGDSNQSGAIKTRPQRVYFRLRLPAGSPGGSYNVVLADVYGRTVRASESQSADGKILPVEIDLREFNERRLRLCVNRQGESPGCVPLYITRQ